VRWLRNPLAVGLALGLLLGGWVFAHRLGWTVPLLGSALEILEREALDARFVLRGPEPAGDEVVILAFDDQTLAEAPELFERRDGWRQVFAALAAARPRVVGVDALFTDPEALLAADLTRDLEAWAADPGQAGACQACGAAALLGRVLYELQADQRLEAEVRALGNVFLALHLGVGGAGEAAEAELAKAKYGQVVLGPRPPVEGRRLLASLPGLNAAARGLGLITLQEDDTHEVRSLCMARNLRGGTLAPLSVQLVAAYRGLSRSRLAYLGRSPDGGAEVRLGDQRVALEPGDEMLLNARGPAGTFRTCPVLDLVRGRLGPEVLADKIVLLGYTHLGNDNVRSPFGRGAGVEIHATAIDNLLRGDPLRRADAWADALLVFLLAGLVGLLYWPRLGLRLGWQLGLSLLLLLGALGGGQLLFARARLWLAAAGPLLAFALASASGLALAYLGEGLKRRQVRRTFAHYLSDQVIERLLAHPENLRPGGERRVLSVLFSDIRGFTTLAEGLEPEVLTELLNGYLTPMTDLVLRNEGLLDKYIGDALMAVFGAPVPLPEHAAAACTTALEMGAALEVLRPTWRALGLDGPEIGVGINTGPMSVGNMGSARRFDYTVVGDHVNLASRLEGLNKVFGTRILVSESTRQAAGEGFTFREVARVAVKGRREAVRVFELVKPGAPDPAVDAWLAEFERGLAAFHARRWDEALSTFEGLQRARGDRPSGVLAERCRALRAAPPPPDWDGVWHMQDK
jgi:adenylate cyclase